MPRSWPRAYRSAIAKANRLSVNMDKVGSDPRAGVRFAAVLRALAEGADLESLNHIAQMANLPVSTVHRILEQMVELGLAERGRNRLYGIGCEFSRIGALAAQKLDIVRVARPFMQSIVAECNETCLLGLYMPTTRQLAFVEKIDAKFPLKYRAQMNVHRTLAWGATGRVILAWLPQQAIDEILANAPPSPADQSQRPDPDAIRGCLEQIRQRGYAKSCGERTAGAVGIAAPIFRGNMGIAGDLCLTIPAFRFERTLEARYARLLIDAANELSRLLGATNQSSRPSLATRSQSFK
jgi:DNA-binding IclR family transcriptional regulator